MSKLFESFTLRNTVFKNRIVVSPMCQYSANDGLPNAWHLVHLGSRAVGGAALVIAEATGVSPEARISPGDTGLWNDDQAEEWKAIVDFIQKNNSLAGIQLAHAGRKASTGRPWEKDRVITPQNGGWIPLAPSAIPFDENSPTPKEMTENDIQKVIADFEAATRRALDVGFDVVEVHAAHGYLLHEFLSPLCNKRTDQYGGSFENRTRLLEEICTRVRKIWPQDKALFVRISASDWADDGWDVAQSVALCKKLKKIGVDLIDVSSGGAVSHAKIKLEPGYQVPFSSEIRANAEIPTGAVGLITEAKQAEEILQSNKADLIFLARELLRDPYWPRTAAKELEATIPSPKQYGRAW